MEPNDDASLLRVAGTLNKAGSGTHGDFAGALFAPPTIGAGGGTLTNASTVKITSAPTGATNNRALWVAAGRAQFDGDVGIGGTPNANAILDCTSTTKAFMPPRMTEAQRDAIPSPTLGMVIINTTTGKLNIRGAAAWEAVTSS